jgi:hypothetical protein
VPQDRSALGRLGAHALHSKYDSKALTAPARAAFYTRFEDEVDPDRLLDPKERARRAQHAFRAHMLRLALASAEKRRAK